MSLNQVYRFHKRKRQSFSMVELFSNQSKLILVEAVLMKFVQNRVWGQYNLLIGFSQGSVCGKEKLCYAD